MYKLCTNKACVLLKTINTTARGNDDNYIYGIDVNSINNELDKINMFNSLHTPTPGHTEGPVLEDVV